MKGDTKYELALLQHFSLPEMSFSEIIYLAQPFTSLTCLLRSYFSMRSTLTALFILQPVPTVPSGILDQLYFAQLLLIFPIGLKSDNI